MKNLTRYGLLLLSSFIAAPSFAESVWTTDGFEMPESAIYDSARNHIILTNINGAPNALDGNGYLSKLSADGKVIEEKWTTGLDAPKGIAQMGDRLFVADMGQLRIVDANSGDLVESITANGAVFLNDVTTDGTRVFISDMMKNSIWLYQDNKLSLWLESDELSHPNGILWEKDHLLVGSWGKGLHDDFTTDTPGRLLSVNPANKKITTLTEAFGNIDGIVRVDGALYANDWINGNLWQIKEDGTVLKVKSFPAGLADISTMNDALLMPHMLSGKLEKYDLN